MNAPTQELLERIARYTAVRKAAEEAENLMRKRANTAEYRQQTIWWMDKQGFKAPTAAYDDGSILVEGLRFKLVEGRDSNHQVTWRQLLLVFECSQCKETGSTVIDHKDVLAGLAAKFETPDWKNQVCDSCVYKRNNPHGYVDPMQQYRDANSLDAVFRRFVSEMLEQIRR